MEAQDENSLDTTNTNPYKITIGVCVMEKKVKCGSEVLFLVCFFLPKQNLTLQSPNRIFLFVSCAFVFVYGLLTFF